MGESNEKHLQDDGKVGRIIWLLSWDGKALSENVIGPEICMYSISV